MAGTLLNTCGRSKSKAEFRTVIVMIMVMVILMMLQVDLKATKFQFKLDRITENQELFQTRIRCCFSRIECLPKTKNCISVGLPYIIDLVLRA